MYNSCTIQILLSLIPILKQQFIKQINETYQYIYIYIKDVHITFLKTCLITKIFIQTCWI